MQNSSLCRISVDRRNFGRFVLTTPTGTNWRVMQEGLWAGIVRKEFCREWEYSNA
jgi:hypothetical protein